VQDRPKGRILCDSCLQRAPAPFAFHLGCRDVPVYLPPIWPCISTTGVHQGSTTSSRSSTFKGCEVCDLLGRSPHHGRKQRRGSLTMCSSNTTARVLGLPGELLKVSDHTYAGGYLLGSQHRLKDKRTKSFPSKAVSDTETSQEAPGADVGLGKRAGTICGEALGNSTSNSSSSPPLSKSSTPEASGAEGQPELQQSYPCIPSCQGGPRVVASRSLYVEWKKPAGQSSRVGDRDGCLPERVGSLLSGQSHRWPVVRGGTEPPYQRAGIARDEEHLLYTRLAKLS